jgi:uncharacterized protein
LDTYKSYGFPYTQDGGFEWDDDKAARNWRDHAVSFEMARDAFKDPFAIEWLDAGQDPREGLVAMIAKNRLLFVAHTVRAERIRIITARKAEPYERRKYHDENGET